MDTAVDLRASDARAALAFAGEVAACRSPAQLKDRFAELPRLVGAEGVIVTACRDWATEVVLEIGDPAQYRGELLGAIGHYWREHPVLCRDLAGADGGARRLSDFVPGREWRRRGLFNDFYRPLGLAGELSVQLAWGPAGSSCCVALHRADRDFSARELALLGAVAPHLRAARERLEASAVASAAPANWDDADAAAQLTARLPLTRRQAEVLASLAAGRTNDGIGLDLGISRHTVARHVEQLYAKLGVHTRAAATRVALAALAQRTIVNPSEAALDALPPARAETRSR